MKKRNQGITLIALVITIIVLLILAGISIAMLTGENGVLTKANTAKNETERKDIIERARIDILAKQSENLGSLSQKELSDILTEKYGTLSAEENILDKTLTSKDGKYEIKVNEIWNGKFKESGSSSAEDDEYIDFKINEFSFRVRKGTTWSDFDDSEEGKKLGMSNYRAAVYIRNEDVTGMDYWRGC